jgi:hypothetical protein
MQKQQRSSTKLEKPVVFILFPPLLAKALSVPEKK